MNISLVSEENNIYVLKKDNSNYIEFSPNRGGLITKWINDSNSILYFDENRFLDKSKSIRGGIPILFPICGNLKTNSSIYGKNFLNLMQHGFARNHKWEYEFIKDKSCLSLLLHQNEEIKKYFPYDFKIEINIYLEVNCLYYEIYIHNNSDTNMPINFGLHPYFNISDFNKIQFIDFPLNCLNQKKNTIELTKELLKDINNGIDLLIYSSGKSSFIDYGFSRKINLVHSSPFDISVIWSDPPRKMVCLEPWTSPRNSLIEGFRQILIPPNNCHKLCALLSVEKI